MNVEKSIKKREARDERDVESVVRKAVMKIERFELTEKADDEVDCEEHLLVSEIEKNESDR